METATTPGLAWSRRGAHGAEFVQTKHRKGSVKVRRGVYAEAAWWNSLRPYQRYELRVRAAAIALHDPIFALESAAVVHGLPVFGEPDVRLFSAKSTRGYRRNGVSVHASADPRTIVRIDGMRATSLLDTTLDLIRVLPLALGVAVIDAALRQGLDLNALRRTLADQSNARGRRFAHEAVDRADVSSESVLESISRVIIDLLGYPPPELQVEFQLPHGVARTDFFWRDARIVGEADGNAKYFGPETNTDEVVRDERRREVALRRVVGGLVRWEWADVVQPSRIDKILAGAGLARVRPADPLIDKAVRNARTRP